MQVDCDISTGFEFCCASLHHCTFLLYLLLQLVLQANHIDTSVAARFLEGRVDLVLFGLGSFDVSGE